MIHNCTRMIEQIFLSQLLGSQTISAMNCKFPEIQFLLFRQKTFFGAKIRVAEGCMYLYPFWSRILLVCFLKRKFIQPNLNTVWDVCKGFEVRNDHTHGSNKSLGRTIESHYYVSIVATTSPWTKCLWSSWYHLEMGGTTFTFMGGGQHDTNRISTKWKMAFLPVVEILRWPEPFLINLFIEIGFTGHKA